MLAGSPAYIDDVFKLAGYPNTNTRAFFLKLNVCERLITGKKTLYYIAPYICNNLPNFVPEVDSFNTYKPTKKHFLTGQKIGKNRDHSS